MKVNIKNFKTPFVIILVGVPLSGKSTLIKSLLIENSDISIISRDDILMSLYDGNDYNLAWKSVNQKEVDKLLVKKFESTNLERKNAIVDMTNLSSKRREQNLAYFDDDYYKVAIVFPEIKKEVLYERNKERHIKENKFIAEKIIDTMINSYQPIKYTENFNKIINL